MTKTINNHVGLQIEKNSFVDNGEGIVEFQNGLSITDDSVQRNGTTYDVNSIDISEYKGQVTADHVDKLENIIAKVEGIEKVGNKVIIKKIKYAVKENPLARLAYNLLVNGFSTDFSIETYGPQPEGDGLYKNHKVIGLSQVVVGNNKGANTVQLNAVIKNSIEQSKEDGLDTAPVEEVLENTENTENDSEKIESEEDESKRIEAAEAEKADEAALEAEADEEAEESEESEDLEEDDDDKEDEELEKDETDESADDKEKKENNNKNKETDGMKFVTIKNSRDFPVTVSYKNAADEEVETVLEAGKTVDVSEDQKEAVETQVSNAAAPQVDVEAEIEKAVNAVKSDFAAQFEELKKAFNSAAKEPEFKATGAKNDKTENAYADLSYKERHAKQINAAFEYLKMGRIESAKVLNDVNEVNFNALKEAGKIENSMTIADFGNFVISPELLTEIQGKRNDYTELINRTDWRETLSIEFAWLKRNGDINMQNVEFCDDGADGNLKPISEYDTETVVSKLEELAAVTPVCNAATRFLAVDLLSDVARGYRNDYDRKRAQLVIARLQQAVNANPANSIDYTANPGTADSLTSWVQLWAKVAETTVNGVYIFNMSTFAAIQKAAVDAGTNGPLSTIFLTGDVPTIFGRPFIIVPNDLLPSINSGQTRVFEVEGANVTINHAVFYFELDNFTGRTSGGLQYDLSTDASYEVNGVVRSAYQRNEMVLRGSFFRGGAILDDTRVAGMSSDVAVVVS